MSFWRSPSFPVCVLLLVAPALAVAQFRIMAPAVPIALLLAVVAHWRIHRALPWPWPRGPLLPAMALAGWALLSAVWSPDAWRAAETALTLGGLVLLAGAAARALAEDWLEHREKLGPALAIGLAIGIVLLGFDEATGNLFRRAVRGFPAWAPQLGWGLKPAVSILALMLPLVLAVPRLPAAWKAAIIVPGLAVALWLPGDSAKIAAVLGLCAALAAMRLPRLVAATAAVGFGAMFLVAPLVFSLALARVPDLSPLPLSAAHRVMIWDFVTQRVDQRPNFGWGMEASRAIPGGTQTFDRATLDRFGLDSERERAAFAVPSAQRLPLHTHNNALQVWLELGLVGAVIATALIVAVMLAAGAMPIAPAALGAAVAAAVTGQLSFGAWQPWWVAAMLFAAVVARGLSMRR